jgi:hypothetical protein
VEAGAALRIEFSDAEIAARADGPAEKPHPRSRRKDKARQGSLFD